MDWSQGSERIIPGPSTDASDGRVVWRPVKSIWIGAMTAIALVAGPFVFSWGAPARLPGAVCDHAVRGAFRGHASQADP